MNKQNLSATDLFTKPSVPTKSKDNYVSEYVINEMIAGIKTEQLDSGTKLATVQNYSEPDITPYLESNNNKSDQEFTSKVKTEIKEEPDDSVFQAVNTNSLFCSDLLSCLPSKQKYLLSNCVPDKLVSAIKKEYVDELSDPINISNKIVYGSPENFDRERHVIKSKPNEIKFKTETNPIEGKNPGKLKGAVVLRERLLMCNSQIQTKREPIEVDELIENMNDQMYDSDQENKDPNISYNNKLDAIKVYECSNNHRKLQAIEVGDNILPSNDQMYDSDQENKDPNISFNTKLAAIKVKECSNIHRKLQSIEDGDIKIPPCSQNEKVITKREPVQVNELKENVISQMYDSDQENKDPNISYNTKLDAIKMKECNNNNRQIQSIEVGDIPLPSCSKNEKFVDDTGYPSNSEYKIALNHHGNMSPLINQSSSKRIQRLFNEKLDAIEAKEKNKYKAKLDAIQNIEKNKFKAKLKAIEVKERSLYKVKLDALEVKERSKYIAKLDVIEAKERSKYIAKLDAIEVKERSKYNAKLDALEAEEISKYNSKIDAIKSKEINKNNAKLNTIKAEERSKLKYNANLNALEQKEVNSNNSKTYINEVCRNTLPCYIQSGIVVNKYDFNSNFIFVKNWFADLVPFPGLPHKRCTLSILMGFDHIQTLICHEKYIFLNETAIQCKWINSPIRVQFDGIWNKIESNFIVFVIWNGNKPSFDSHQKFIFPPATDYFDVEGKCTRIGEMLKINVNKFGFTLKCSDIVTSFLNGNKVLKIPDDTTVSLYLRKCNSPNIEPMWAILWMILYIK